MPQPDWKREIAARLGVDADAIDEQPLIQELTDHLQDRYEGMKRNGATEEEAVAAALAELEGVELPSASSATSGAVREVADVRAVRDAWHDARQPAPPE